MNMFGNKTDEKRIYGNKKKLHRHVGRGTFQERERNREET